MTLATPAPDLDCTVPRIFTKNGILNRRLLKPVALFAVTCVAPETKYV